MNQTKKPNQKKPNKLRTCIACGNKAIKVDMVRFVADKEGNVVIDPAGRQPGRGANLCHNKECFDLALKKNSFGRALRRKVNVKAIESLREDLQFEEKKIGK